MKQEYIVGVDEVGRGPVAGPLYVCACMTKPEYLDEIVKEAKDPVRDSKKLTKNMRNRWNEYLRKLKDDNKIWFAIVSVPAYEIDRVGMSEALRISVKEALVKLVKERSNTQVFLDGGLKAPVQYIQQTIIKGDEKYPVIAFASILAKVARDSLMVDFAEKYPDYGFDAHKGYGTIKHMEAIRTFGATQIHRLSFLGNILE